MDLTVRFDEKWLEEKRAAGVRVIRVVEKWIGGQGDVKLKASTRSSVTVTIGVLSRPMFVSGLEKLVRDELHVSNPGTVISYGDEGSGQTAEAEVSPAPSQETPPPRRTEDVQAKACEAPPEADPEKVLEELLQTVPIRHSRELTAFFRETAAVAPVLRQMDALESFWGQCLLVSIDSGYGLSEFLGALSKLYIALGLVKDGGDKAVREILVERPADAQRALMGWETAVETAGDMERANKKNGAGRSILCLDIGAWQGSLAKAEIKAQLRKLNVQSRTFTLVFRVPCVDARTLVQTEEALADIFNVRTLIAPPLELASLVDYARGELAKRSFSLEAGTEDVLERWILEEKRDDSFFGYRTMDKLVDRMIYAKALGNCRSGEIDRTIRAADIADGQPSLPPAEEDPQEELDRLIGLAAVKTKVLEIIAQIKAQRKLSAMGRKVKRPTIHMLFSGNPGTGKTTVARIVARLLKKEGVLRKGHLLEVKGRDLCGEYVGQTAPKTSAICRDAYGSVLFIDEAYSLFRGDDNDRDYGREALDTLIAEMENHRDDLCVIMAGYAEDMETMLGGNEGLRSRIPYTIEFPDYSREELCRIFFSMMRNTFDYEEGLEEEVEKFFDAIPDEVLRSKGFANARLVRNLYERTWGKAAYRSRLEDGEIRVLASDLAGATEEREFRQLMVRKTSRRPIGFGN